VSDYTLRCPAAEFEHGALSIHRQDVRCRLSGLLQGAEEAPCVRDSYQTCPIWCGEKKRIWANKHAARAPQMINHDGEWEKV
jgi:hypothetical protein